MPKPTQTNSSYFSKTAKHNPRFRRDLCSLLLPVLILVFALRSFGWLEPLSLKAFDVFSQILATSGQSPYVTAIALTDDDLTRLARPRDAQTLLTMLKKLQSEKVNSVLLLEKLDQTEADSLNQLAEFVIQQPNYFIASVALPAQNSEAYRGLARSLRVLNENYKLLEFSISMQDSDSLQRRVVVAQTAHGVEKDSIALVLARSFLANNALLPGGGPANAVLDRQAVANKNNEFGEYVLNSDPAGFQSVLIRPTHWLAPLSYSYSDLLNNHIPSEHLAGRAIVIAPSAQQLALSMSMAVGSNWYSRTSYSLPERVAAGVDLLIAAGLGETKIIWAMPEWANLLLIALITAIAAAIFIGVTPRKRAIAIVMVLCGLLSVSALFALWIGLWLPWLSAMLAVFLCTIELIRRTHANAAELKDFVTLMQAAFNKLPEPLLVKDGRNQLCLANDAMCLLLGRSKADLIGASLTELWPELATRVEAKQLQLTDAFGRNFSVQLQCSSLPPELDARPILLCMVRAKKALDPITPESIENLTRRVNLARSLYLAHPQGWSLSLLIINDYEDVRSALGEATAHAYANALQRHLAATLPQLESLTDWAPGRFLLLEQAPADARARILAACSEGLDVEGELLIANVSCYSIALAADTDLASALTQFEALRHDSHTATGVT